MKAQISLLLLFITAVISAAAQEAPPIGAPSTVIKTEAREVLVDTIVTDKHGNYIRDLTIKDFRVWEDDKEQKIKSFQNASDPASPASAQKHYLVLFFDNSTMDLADQGRARIAAGQFIDANAGPNQYIAIANFGGTLQIAQNFTQDAARLKKVATSMKFSAVSPNDGSQVASLGVPPVLSNEAEFGVRTVILALRSLAKSLAAIPGRKSVVFLSAGFQVTPELESEVTAAIDACNKANVAVYPIDVRGLSTGMSAAHASLRRPAMPGSGRLVSAGLRWSAVQHSQNGVAHLVYVGQRAGGGGAGGAPRGAGGGAPRAAGPAMGGARPMPPPMSPMGGIYRPRPIVPPLISSTAANQQVLEQLAQGTGGFVIINSNDLLGGMQKVSQEQSQYYILGYAPAEADDGSCHTLKVKVDRGGTMVRARTGYCNVKPVDLLAGKPIEKELESRANGSQSGVTASMLSPFFYTSGNTARVDLAIEMPPDAIKFDKEKGKYKGSVDVLGIAYKPDGAVAAKFSDTANLEFPEKKELEEFNKHPYHYENQFDIAAGTYTLKVAFTSSGQSFGKLESPLVIAPYDQKQFAISSLALSRKMLRVSDITSGLESELLEDRKPLVYQGVQLIPTGSNHFAKTEPVGAYLEVYDPFLLADNPPKLALEIHVFDRASGKDEIRAAITNTAEAIKPGSPVVPMALHIPVDKLNPGAYRLDLRAIDTAGHASSVSSAEFELQ
jgi:VWFA-related protein